MRIRFFGYNCFIIETGDKRIAIDPGASFYLPDFFSPLIPRSEWPKITHILITHGDPDHHWHSDRIAKASGAKIICSRKMVRNVNGKHLMLGPRSKGLTFITGFEQLFPIAVGESINLDGMHITGILGTHGPLTLKIGPFKRTLHEGPEERFGYGEMGFQMIIDGKSIINLGDTILHEPQWRAVNPPDILMIPIGGEIPGNTMDEKDALIAVKTFNPKLVIPTHYNCGALFSKCYNPADAEAFKEAVEKLGPHCSVLGVGDSVDVDD